MNPNDRISNFKIYIAQTPDDPFPRYGLAMEYRSMGQIEKAQIVFDELVERFPDYVATYLMAGSNLAELGRTDEALVMFERGVRMSARKGDMHTKNELQAALDNLRASL